MDVHHLALGPRRVLVLHHEGDGLHEHGVLGPGLQVGQQHARVHVAVLVELHVHHVPAVGATALLALKRTDVLEGSVGTRGHIGSLTETQDRKKQDCSSINIKIRIRMFNILGNMSTHN